MLIYCPGDPLRKADKMEELVFPSVIPVLAYKQQKFTKKAGTSSHSQKAKLLVKHLKLLQFAA